MGMNESEVNIYSIAYRDCKEVSDSIDVNEEFGKTNTILFYMDEILEALKIASELQEIGTVEELQALKEKNEPKKPDHEGDGYYKGQLVLDTWICPNCGKYYEVDYDDYDFCPNCGQHIDHSGLTEDD